MLSFFRRRRLLSAPSDFFVQKKGDEPLPAASPFVGSYLCRLSTETKLLNDSSVSLNINLLEIIKDTTSLTNKLQE